MRIHSKISLNILISIDFYFKNFWLYIMCRQLDIFFVFIIISVETVWHLISNFIVINKKFNRIIEIFILRLFLFWRYKSFHLYISFYFYYFCQIILYLGLGKKSRYEEPNRTRSEKVVPNPNRNWLNIRTGSKFWYLKNRNWTRSKPKYLGYPNITKIDLYT